MKNRLGRSSVMVRFADFGEAVDGGEPVALWAGGVCVYEIGEDGEFDCVGC